jgi:hypothetical protein
LNAKAGPVLAASTISTVLLHITGHMKGRSLRGHYRLRSGGFMFVDSRGVTWELKHVSSGKRWRLTRKASQDTTGVEQSWGFTNPASWYPGETQVVAGARVTPRTVQRIVTFALTKDQTLATAAPDSTETFDISADRDPDAEVAAFAIYLARVEGTVSIGMMIILFAILGKTSHVLSMLAAAKLQQQGSTESFRDLAVSSVAEPQPESTDPVRDERDGVYCKSEEDCPYQQWLSQMRPDTVEIPHPIPRKRMYPASWKLTPEEQKERDEKEDKVEKAHRENVLRVRKETQDRVQALRDKEIEQRTADGLLSEEERGEITSFTPNPDYAESMLGPHDFPSYNEPEPAWNQKEMDELYAQFGEEEVARMMAEVAAENEMAEYDYADYDDDDDDDDE